MKGLELKLSEDAQAMFATRMLRCYATDCRHNGFNMQHPKTIACNLQQIEMGEGGQCKFYEPMEDASDD